MPRPVVLAPYDPAWPARASSLSSSSGEAKRRPGDPVRGLTPALALTDRSGSPGLRGFAACRRMTKERGALSQLPAAVASRDR